MIFEEWMVDATSWSEKDCYNAGAQSRQAEIDELQKRINKAISAVMDDKCSHTVIDILKGETNE